MGVRFRVSVRFAGDDVCVSADVNEASHIVGLPLVIVLRCL